ncbi:MAG: ABC transporter permease [Sedimentisphaerales bacterium]|nr:ABC transporter permease [Sedimentisphaerales bacterium]
MGTSWQDIRYGVRILKKSPVFTVVVTLSLAIGIGANAVVFTWIQAVLLDATEGMADPGRLVVVCPRHRTAGLDQTMSFPDIQSLAEQRNAFVGITASQMGAATLQVGDTTEWVWSEFTLANYFDVLGVRPIVGRGFRPGEDQPDAGSLVAVISHGLWQRRFGSDPLVVGRIVQINRRPVTIVGVAPAGFKGMMGALRFDLWAPLPVEMEATLLRERFERRGSHWLHTMARLGPGVSRRQAQAVAATIAGRLGQEFPVTSRDKSFAILPVWKCPWGGQGFMLPLLRVLALVAGLLLLLVAANVANLLLARTRWRRPEMAVRLALGASRRRVVRQLLTESSVLAVLGGLCGTAGALWGMNLLFEFIPSTPLPVALQPRLNWPVLAATAAVTILAGILVGLAPAFHNARTGVNEALKAGGRMGSSSPHRLRGAFVVAEVALALVLLLGMGLCVRSFDKARHTDLGLNPRQVFVASFRISRHSGDAGYVRNFYRRLRVEVGRLPGVEVTALADSLPLGLEGGSGSSVEVPGYQPAVGESMGVEHSIVSPDYFRALRIPILEGREFTEQDDAEAAPVVVVNEAFVKRYLAGRSAIGHEIGFWDRRARIIGVAKNGKYRALNEPLHPYFYMCQQQILDRDLTLILRTRGDPAAVAGEIERLAATIDATARPFAAMSLQDYIGAAFTVPRIAATMLSLLGVLALLLAAMGTYAVIATGVNERTREIGVRIALGAQGADILRLVLRHGVLLTLLGIGIGAAAGLAASRMLAGLLVGIGPRDLLTWCAGPLLLLGATALASWLPARRAMKIDPTVALRYE